MKNKKDQGISINVIIVAAIALIVLVVLAVIFIGRLGTFSTSVESCENKGGRCFSFTPCGELSAEDYPIPTDWTCPTEGEHCCLKLS